MPENEQLSEQQVWDVLKFAQNLNPILGNGVYTPDMINQNMQRVNMNPRAADKDKIETALSALDEDSLIAYSEYYELTDMLYKRMIGYIGNMLSFDLTFYPTNAKVDELKSKKYKKEEEKIKDFLESFDYKKEFKKALRMMASREVYFTQFRRDGAKPFLQQMPDNYAKITGRFEYGILYDLNMNWFMQPSVDINMYSDEVKQLYYDWYEFNKSQTYRPSNGLGNRKGSYSYWKQTSPEEGFFCWKFNPDIASKIPYFSPLLTDISLKPLIRNLQTNIYFLQAQKLLVGTIPLLNDRTGGKVTDALAIKPETMGRFLNLIKQGLHESIKIGAAPFDEIEEIDFNTANGNILEQYTKNTSAMSGTNSRLLFGIDKPNALETKLSSEIDEYLVTYIYPYFEDFLNYYANMETDNFKFKFKFEGTEFSANRKERQELQFKLMDKGIVMKQKIAASFGLSIREMEMYMAMTDADGFRDGIVPLISAYTMGKEQTTNKVSNRPKKAVEDMTDSGMATEETGSNIEKGV